MFIGERGVSFSRSWLVLNILLELLLILKAMSLLFSSWDEARIFGKTNLDFGLLFGTGEGAAE